MATNTRSQTAAATVTTAPEKRTTVTELKADVFGPLFDELSVISLERAELEAREKAIKQTILEAVGKPLDRKHTIAVKVGSAIRVKVGLRARSGISKDDLMAGFPEAYEACKTESEYAVISPA